MKLTLYTSKLTWIFSLVVVIMFNCITTSTQAYELHSEKHWIHKIIEKELGLISVHESSANIKWNNSTNWTSKTTTAKTVKQSTYTFDF